MTTRKTTVLADAELAVLGLLAGDGAASGYGLLRLVEARGMSRWAGLSPTSVYNSLRSLRRRQLVSAARDRAKRGRGPPGLRWSATPAGARALRANILRALREAREQSATFRLALANSDAIPVAALRAGISRRIAAIDVRLARIRAARAGTLPPRRARGARLLFAYSEATLRHEVRVLRRLSEMAA